MLNRTSRLLCAGALVLAPALASCSTEMPTDAIYTQAAGVNDRSLEVDVLNAMIVSSERDSGTLIFTLASNAQLGAEGSETDTLTRVEVDGKPAKLSPIEIAPASAVVVAERTDAMPSAVGGIKVTGSFAAGDFVDVVFTFKNAGTTETLQVPVLLNEEGSYVAGQDGDPIPVPAEEEHAEESGGGH